MKGGDFIPLLQERTLRGGRRECDVILDKISKTTHALPVSGSRESDFKPERIVVPRLHDIG